MGGGGGYRGCDPSRSCYAFSLTPRLQHAGRGCNMVARPAPAVRAGGVRGAACSRAGGSTGPHRDPMGAGGLTEARVGGIGGAGTAGQVSVAVLIDKFVSATALIKFEEVERALNERKSKEVLLRVPPMPRLPGAAPSARRAQPDAEF